MPLLLLPSPRLAVLAAAALLPAIASAQATTDTLTASAVLRRAAAYYRTESKGSYRLDIGIAAGIGGIGGSIETSATLNHTPQGLVRIDAPELTLILDGEEFVHASPEANELFRFPLKRMPARGDSPSNRLAFELASVFPILWFIAGPEDLSATFPEATVRRAKRDWRDTIILSYRGEFPGFLEFDQESGSMSASAVDLSGGASKEFARIAYAPDPQATPGPPEHYRPGTFEGYRDLTEQMLESATGLDDMVGKPAPDFQLHSFDGKPVKLADFRGRALVLHFWAFESDIGREGIPQAQAIAAAYGADRVAFLGMNCDSAEKMDDANQYVLDEKSTLDAHVRAGLDQSVLSDYRLVALPTFVVIAADGTIAGTVVGLDDGWQERLRTAIDGALAAKK